MKFKDLIFEPIDERCQGCSFVAPLTWKFGISKCRVYFRPKSWWRHGPCPLATHLVSGEEETPLAAHQRRKREGRQKRRSK